MPFAIYANDVLQGNRETMGFAALWFPMPIKPPSTLFGRRLRAARQAADMTQTELGRLLGLEDQNTAAPRVSRYETGKHEPDQETMARIAEALGLPVAYFHAVDDILAEVILLVAKMPKKDQEEILDLLRKRTTKG